MQKKSDFFLRLAFIIGDSIAITLSFAFAYFIRTHVIKLPYYFESEITSFTISVIYLVPILIVILAALGLYRKDIYLSKRFAELGRIFISAILSVTTLITYGYFTGEEFFPVRPIALIAMALCLVMLIIERTIIRLTARQIFKKDFGTKRVVIIGNNKNTKYLADYIAKTPESGYRLNGVVANKKNIPKGLKIHQYSSLKEAIKKSHPDVIFQTDEKNTEYVYKQAIDHHILYYFVPSESALSSSLGELELVGNTPAMLVKPTPLGGGFAVLKRAFDIVFAIVAIIVAAIPMLIIWIISKLTDIKHSPIYVDNRLTRYNRRFKCYKFRSMKPEYSGMTAEAAFTKMGREELIAKYRKDGDYIKNDPRITRLGKFIRRTSLDELPQLFNILKGDISLIGPRALLPNELKTYGDRSLILSVKSGLTGLAQVSGRRDISFEERRALDIYYVRNWSITMDLQIFLKTIVTVIKGNGAK